MQFGYFLKCYEMPKKNNLFDRHAGHKRYGIRLHGCHDIENAGLLIIQRADGQVTSLER